MLRHLVTDPGREGHIGGAVTMIMCVDTWPRDPGVTDIAELTYMRRRQWLDRQLAGHHSGLTGGADLIRNLVSPV